MTLHPEAAAISGPAGGARDQAIAHLRTCAACRARLVEDDPSALFALLAASPVPAGILEDLSRGVFAEAGREGADAAASVGPGRGARYAAAAASVLLAAALGALSLRQAPGPAAPATASSSAPPRATVSVVPGSTPAQVVDLTVGETQVVMIFDPGASL